MPYSPQGTSSASAKRPSGPGLPQRRRSAARHDDQAREVEIVLARVGCNDLLEGGREDFNAVLGTRLQASLSNEFLGPVSKLFISGN